MTNGTSTKGDELLVEIVVEGQLDDSWRQRFGNLAFSYVPDVHGTRTCMSGRLADQAQLHAALTAIRDLGLTLVLVRRVASDGDSSD